MALTNNERKPIDRWWIGLQGITLVTLALLFAFGVCSLNPLDWVICAVALWGVRKAYKMLTNRVD